MLDACARRHIAFRIYKTVAALRQGAMSRKNLAFIPINARTVYHLPSLTGHQNLPSISDAAIHAELRGVDNCAGYWTEFDPGLEDILSWARSKYGHILNMYQVLQ